MVQESRQKPDALLSDVGIPVNVLLFPEQREKLRLMAYQNEKNLSQTIRMLIDSAQVNEE
jgi:hypothetical protein